MVLRHRRHSHDLDFMTLQPFDSRAVAAKLLSSAAQGVGLAQDDDRELHRAKLRLRAADARHRHERPPRLRARQAHAHPTSLTPAVVERHRDLVERKFSAPAPNRLMATKLDVMSSTCRQGRSIYVAIDIAAMEPPHRGPGRHRRRPSLATKQLHALEPSPTEETRLAHRHSVATSPSAHSDPDPAISDHPPTAERLASHLATRRDGAVLDWRQLRQRPGRDDQRALQDRTRSADRGPWRGHDDSRAPSRLDMDPGRVQQQAA